MKRPRPTLLVRLHETGSTNVLHTQVAGGCQSLTDLSLSFWGYALDTDAFTLNRAPYKSIEMTPYELWFGKKPKLSFLKV